MRATLIKKVADPWARRDAWRYQGQFSKASIYRNLWPGFSYGVGAFFIYCIGEKVLGVGKHSHNESHAEH